MKKIVGTVVAVCALMLAGCVNNDPFGTANDPDTITIGSQDYYSNEIIAEIYAQALEKRGHKVKRELRIGQREAYLPEIESGSIDLFPEYTGPL
ncbi:glycine betaine ABC transporter substrate-binding protein, partial [Corynebacterium durum]